MSPDRRHADYFSSIGIDDSMDSSDDLSKGRLPEIIYRFHLPLGALNMIGGTWSMAMELNRKDRIAHSWSRFPQAQTVTEKNYNLTTPSRLMQWLRVVGQSDGQDHLPEFTLTERVWEQIPDVMVVLWSPLFNREVSNAALTMYLPNGWDLAEPWRDVMMRVRS